MNEEEVLEQPSEKEIKDAKAQQAGKDVADLAGRAASTYFGGAVGNKIYDTVSKTKLGQAALNGVGKSLNNNPLTKNVLEKAQPAISQAKPALDQVANMAGGAKGGSGNSSDSSSASQESSNGASSAFNSLKSVTNPKDDSTGLVSMVSKIKKYWPIISMIGQIFVIAILLILIIAVIMSGLMYIQDVFTNMDEKFLNFVSGCGWSEDSECDTREMSNFYEKVNDEYDEYKQKYNISINRQLLIATLTYDNPFLTTDTEDESSIDYKKSKKQVDTLIKNMVVKEYYKKNKHDGSLTQVSKVYVLTEEESKDYEIVEGDNYCVDEENYRKYLEDVFIIKFYLNNDKTDQNIKKAKDMTKEIFSRAAFAGALANSTNLSKTYNVQNITVTVTDCSGMMTLEQIPLAQYLQGVVYMYSDNNTSTDYLSYLAVAAKNYLYSVNGATPDSMPTNLRIGSCQLNQLYCDVKKGCHYMENNGSSNDTLVSGKDDNGNYFKKPASNDFITIISDVVDAKTTEFIVSDGNIVSTKLVQGQSSAILNDLNNSDYKTVLTKNYGGNIETVSVVQSGYPLDLQHNRVTSLYGWRLHPTEQKEGCRHHNGMDIAAPLDANIYAYADGIVITNKFHYSYGNYTVIGHGNYDNTTSSYEYYTLYAHQSRLSSYVTVGNKVVAGQKIGSVGSTGDSTGNHLHFEIYKYINGEKVASDPATYFSNIEFRGLDVNSPLYPSKDACLIANT